MSTATLVPVEEYLRYSGKPNCEYLDGVLHPKPMPTTLHGLLEFMLVMLLRKLGLRAAPEVTLRISDRKFLVPDVVAAHVLQSPYPTEPVLLCCEILSPEDRIGTMLAKCEEYHAWGVPFCWVIDPVKRTAWEYHASAEPVRVTGQLHAGELAINLDELFADLDR
ncbi:MAG TPA: Uma2 family endonuclease [Bryobacteraceae bacterium]|jgi:Uma2 family endonuclease